MLQDVLMLVAQGICLGFVVWGGALCFIGRRDAPASARHMFDDAGPIASMRGEDFPANAVLPPHRFLRRQAA